MQDLTPDELEMLNRLRQLKKQRAWGEVRVELQAGKPTLIHTTTQDKLTA